MSECTHTVVDADIAWGDGLCAYCLREKLAALRKDKARADWDEEHPGQVFYSWGLEQWYRVDHDEPEAGYRTRREAIDAAMEAEGE